MLLLLMAGCKADTTIECETSQNCPADSACVDGLCQKRECIISGDCQIGHFCDQSAGRCQPGCGDDGDCAYGDACISGQCKARPCRSAELDCQVGQYCDTVTGTCFDAAGPYCTPCVTSENCGGGNNRCLGGFCAPECNDDRPCPAGYMCTSGSQWGNITGYYCVTLCENIDNLPPSSTKRAPGADRAAGSGSSAARPHAAPR